MLKDLSHNEILVENSGVNSKFISVELLSKESVTDIIKKLQNHPSIQK